MNLRKVLTPASVSVRLSGSSKQEIIDSLISLAMKSGKVKDREEALACVLEREEKMSTGMKSGIGIPHGKSSCVDGLVACVAVSENPVDFDALDKKPCRIFVMTISNKYKTGPHLEFLAEVTRLLNDEEFRQQLLTARTDRELYEIICG